MRSTATLRIRRFTLIFALMAPFNALALAAQKDPAELKSPVDMSDILGLASSLILVIGAILVVGWLYARMQGIRGGGAGGVINILAAQSLGPKERIVLVEVGSKQIVVGVTAANLQTLHVFDERIVNAAEIATASPFADRLRTAIKGVRK